MNGKRAIKWFLSFPIKIYRKRIFVAILSLFLALAFAAGWAEEEKEKYAPNEILVKFKILQQDDALLSLRNRLNAVKIKQFAINDVYQLKLPAGSSVENAVADAYSNPNVVYAEPNYVVDINSTPNDTNFSQLYGLHNTGQTGGTVDADIDAPEAWSIVTEVPDDIIIAVIDTGVDYTHSDLAANMWVNGDEIPDNGIDDDNNGYIDDYRGWDFSYNDNNPMDGHSHGTHCAGTIAAVGNNSTGITGVCWKAKIMPVKFLSDGGSGYTSDAIESVQYAVNNGAKILSNSWGGGGYSQALKDAITEAHNAGALFIAAAGNSGSDNDSYPHYPSSYDVPNVIAVAATDHNDNMAYFSCYGPTSVDLAAPGVSIMSTTPGNNYAKYSGTSMATPHISGICALIWAVNTAETNLQVKNRLFSTVDHLPALSGKMVTGGRANLYKAVTAQADDNAPAAINDLVISGTPTYKSISLAWTATGDDGASGTATSYDLRCSTSAIDNDNFNSASAVTGLSQPKASGAAETFTVSGLNPNTTYYFAIKALDEWGNTASISNSVSTRTGAASVIYQEKVESGPNGWTVSGTDGSGGAALWHQSHNRFQSSTTSWYYGQKSTRNYNTGKRNYGSITSPTINLTAATSADLIFNYWRSVESYSYPYDVLKIEFSPDNGTTWQTLKTISSTTPSKKQWVSSDYIELEPGTECKLRFSFDTRDAIANYYEGIYIDDIEIVGIEPPDDTAPAAITDLAVTATGTTYVKLSWTATGDDGTEGIAFSHDLRYSTGTINDDNWTTATQVTGEPSPETSGQTQSLTVSGLSQGTSYYFALKAMDNAGNESLLSNVTNTTTLTPPIANVNPAEMPLVTLEPNTTTTKTLTISNTGSSPLEFSLTDTKINSLACPVLEAAQAAEETEAKINNPNAAYKENELLVKFRGGAAVSTINAEAGVEVLKTFSQINVYLLKISSAQSLAETLSFYEEHPEVDYAEYNYTAETFALPNDTKFTELYGLHNTGQTGGTADADIDAPEAWDYFTGSEEMVLAVIDTGIDYKHPDLSANMWHNAGEIPGNNIDDDNNGYVDDYYGYDFYNNDGDPWDDHSHGTHCAGTIGGVGDNNIGVAGVNWQVKIMALKFLSAYGSGSYADAVEAILYASDQGAKLSSNSWGGSGYSQALKDAVEYAKNKGCLFVAAAGNSAANSDYSPLYPAAYNSTNIISVAALDHKNNLAWFSNYGATTVDLGAPGVYILSTLPNNSYGKYSGTSMATPHVSGACALVWGQKPTLTAAQVKATILEAAEPIAALTGKSTTGGCLNVFNAIQKEDDEVPPAAISDLVTTGKTFKSITLSWTASGDDGLTGTATGYDLRYSSETITADNFSSATQVAGEPTPKAAGTMESVIVSGLEYNTTYYFALKVKDNVGNWSTLSNVKSGVTATPTIIFQDNMENGSGNWSAQSPWAQTDETAKSTITCWSDSPQSLYDNNIDVSLTSSTLDLTKLKSASIKFWHKYALEKNYDYGYVEISSDNGSSWTQIKSYTSMQNSWVNESLDINAYAGKEIKIRFRLVTDYSITTDGWHIDDIVVLGSATACGWLTPDKTSGTVAPAASTTVTFTYSALDLDPGSFSTEINVSTNDPDNNLVIVPASMIVEPTPPSGPPEIEFSSHTTGTLLNKKQIDISGTIDYNYSVVKVNNTTAAISNNSFGATITLSEGTNTISAVATNSAGTTTKSITLIVDTTQPSINISSPADGSKTSSSTVTASGTASDNLEISTVTVNSKAAALNGSSFLVANISLDEGTNTITAQSIDKAGNTQTASITVIKDTIAPAISITSPQNGAYLKSKKITVSGTVSDANDIGSVTVNGLAASVESHNFNADGISLNEGQNNINITAIDEVGNRSQSSITVYLDTKAPTIKISSPKNGAVTKTASININGYANETVTEVTVNGRVAAISGTNFSFGALNLSAGKNTITAQGKDRADNSNSTSITVTYQAPEASIEVAPTMIPEVTLNYGDTTTQSLNIKSTGEADLSFSVTLNETSTNIYSNNNSFAQAQMAVPDAEGQLIDPDYAEAENGANFQATHAPNRLLVKYKDGISSLQAESINALVGAETVNIYQEIGLHKVEIHSGIELREAINLYMKDDSVAYAEPDYELQALKTPNDAKFSELWGLHNTGQSGGKADADIDAPEAWNLTTGSSTVIIAVIDTGIDYNHSDLAANMWKNTDEIAGNGIDDDANGYVDDYYGYDFYNNDGDPYDDNNHGTHCAGTIAGVGNNGTGVAGVNWTAQVMAVKFLSGGGWGSTSDAIEGIIYAADNGAKILSNSWGGGGYSQALKDAVEYAKAKDVLFVAAAGNSGTNNDQSPSYPASYDSTNIISVAAIDHNVSLAYFSCYGATSVDIGAPGVSIYSTVPGNSYSSFSGTSMATPHVSGVAGLVLAKNSSLNAAQLKAAILNGAVVTSALNGKCVTGGRLNALNALELEEDNTPPSAIDNLAVSAISFQSITLNWTATGDDGKSGTAASYDVRYSTSAITSANFSQATQASSTPAPSGAGNKESFAVTSLAEDTLYYFAIKVNDNVANASGISNLVSATTSKGVAIYSDDMESGTNGWTVSGTDGNGGEALWHLSHNRYKSSNTSFYYGRESQRDYDTGAGNYGTLMSPVIDLTEVSDAGLSFHYWREVESYPGQYDLCYINIYKYSDYSSDTIWYKSSADSSAASWHYSGLLDLSDYCGDQIRVIFIFYSIDGISNSYEGWYIDDVNVYGSITTPDWISASPNIDTLAPGEATEITLYYNGEVPAGEYIGNLRISSNSSSSSAVDIELKLTVNVQPELKWYLAEGCTDGFDQFVLIMNPNESEASVKVTFMKPDGSVVEKYLSVGAKSRLTIYANDSVPNESISTMVESLNNVTIIAERALYWNSGDISWAGGHCTPGTSSLSTQFYFAEGCTANGFDTWIPLMNPQSQEATVYVSFVKPDGSTIDKQFSIPATSRYTIYVNEHVPNESVSTIISSSLPIAAERSMYWNSSGYSWIGGHIATGITNPATSWYLAEGCTAAGFSEWILIMNPNSQEANVSVQFMKPDGSTVTENIIIGPTARYTIHANSHVPDESISTQIESDVPVVAERAMYWDINGIPWIGGHVSPGTSNASLRWNLAEGCTSGTFDEWIPIMNPNSTDARIKVTFMMTDGSTHEEYINIGATSRYTIHVDDYLPDHSLSTLIESVNNIPVIVERAMYWSSSNSSYGEVPMVGGHASLGVE